MRTTEEMLELILNVAKEDPDIRAVLMSGSRANKDCPVDKYQDFDIVYFVKDVQPYWDNMSWIEEKFGKPILVQKPESIELIPPDADGNYMYLMLFEDGNRIDLQFTASPYVDDGEPVVLLLDKDGTFPDIKVQEDFWYVRKPSQKYFADCCNEFHWCLNNVTKGIARDELSYAMKQLNEYVRDMLVIMLQWYVGTRHDFQVSPGKEGKYFKKYLPEELYERFRKTYSDADYEHMWEAAFEMLYLFGDVARDMAEKLGFAYDEEEEQGIEKYMKMVRSGEI
ncbi:MAG: aminoglycoside 6-adenylyltransferase [Lachnospiraceae bacterium]|nr:aminoglycoside 6-adenylyltransferase [Lachnospiraceae bacterium]